MVEEHSGGKMEQGGDDICELVVVMGGAMTALSPA